MFRNYLQWPNLGIVTVTIIVMIMISFGWKACVYGVFFIIFVFFSFHLCWAKSALYALGVSQDAVRFA